MPYIIRWQDIYHQMAKKISKLTEGSKSNPESPENQIPNSIIFMLLGGFLGAGKTTCMIALVEWLHAKGLRCGMVTNDQGDGLVDTALAQSSGSAVQQITGGCFCCRADELIIALRELEKSATPDVIVAEPVGSCTDLVATVLLPLEQVYQTGWRRAPMSVVLDGKRLWQTYFGKARGTGGFSRDVRYIYVKQMEEAEILVVNKADLLSEREKNKLRAKLEQDYPGKRVFFVSARSKEGLEEWFELLLAEQTQPAGIIDVDYQRYGKGEALMGWYNGKVELNMRVEGAENSSASGNLMDFSMDGNDFLLKLAGSIQRGLEKSAVEIAHFKMSLKASSGLAVVNTVRNGSPAERSRTLTDRVTGGELLINVRAEAAPEQIDQVVARAIKKLEGSFEVRWIDQAAFRPGQPNPIHRINEL